MTNNQHDVEVLGVYVLGALDDNEARAVEEHLTGCALCRDELEELLGLRSMLDVVPEKGFFPRARQLSWSRLGLVAAAAAVVAMAVGGGILIGQRGGGADSPVVAQQIPATSTIAPAPSGTRFASNTSPSGARLTVRVEPAAGWVRVNASAAGIQAGEKCRLVVVSRTGERQAAASWLVSANGEKSGTNLDGSALVAPEDVVAVEIETFDGRRLVATAV